MAVGIQPVKSESMNHSNFLIHPTEGYYLNYRVIAAEYSFSWNFTFSYYIQSDLINVTCESNFGGDLRQEWLSVNITNRLITESSPSLNWKYFPFLVQTNITKGDKINWLGSQKAEVVGERDFALNGRLYHCWHLRYFPFRSRCYVFDFWLNKSDGVLVWLRGWECEEIVEDTILIETGIHSWTPTPPVTVLVDIAPNTLNLRSKGKWITAYIELPEGYNVNDINISSILLNDSIRAKPKPTAIGDYDEDSTPDLMVKFDRTEVKAYIHSKIYTVQLVDDLHLRMDITLTITGLLNNGTPFQGTGTIAIIYKIRLISQMLRYEAHM